MIGALTVGLLTVVPAVPAAAAPSNLARATGVSVSASSQNTSTGQTAAKAVDGSAVGYPADYTREWATNGGRAGSWIQLTWPSPVTIDRVVLFDRPNSNDRVTGGSLAFSSGSAVSVGTLNNSGAATTVTFPARTVTTLRFNITSVSSATVNVGLAEIEVWGETGVPANRPPVANAGPDQSVATNVLTTLDGSGSSDPDGQAVTYAWEQTAGTTVQLSSMSAAKPTFTPTTAGARTFRLTVSDGQATAVDTVTVTVTEQGTSMNLARLPGVAVTASSQNTSTGQTALKAVDGVPSGYPADSSKEWATVGGKAGSWIRLAWTSPVTLDRVVLYDRPNLNDRVTGGALVFSDGTSVPVGSLSNSGGATTVTFPARSVTNVRFNISSVASTTYNIGLAEFEAWGSTGPQPPIARAGADQSVGANSVVTLDGSASSDPEGSALTYSWVQTAGPGVALSGSAEARPTFTAGGVGAYTFQLTVSDGTLTATDDVTITVQQPATLTVATSGTSALWTADFDASLRGSTVALQRLRIVTTMTTEVSTASWVAVGSARTLNTNGDTVFTVTDPLEVEHSYRVVLTSSGFATNEVKHAAPRVSPNTGLPTVYVDTNESGAITDTDTYLEGRFTMTGGAAVPQCAPMSAALMKIQGRGNYTWTLDKKGYNFSLDKKADICGMGSDKKWALLANHYDRSLLRNSVALQMGGLMTNLAYTPQSIPIDVYLNGVYQGAYTLVERVGVNTNRVNIDKLEKNTGGVNDSPPNVTGGYLLEWDFRLGGDHNVYVGDSTGWVAIKEPEDEDDGSGITPKQIAYIDQYLTEADEVLFSSNFADPVNGWRKYLDEASTVDFYIVQELTKNLDANMYTSVFMYKTRDVVGKPGKLFMGPLWDFDTAMGDALYPGGQGSPTGWYLRDEIDIDAKQTSETWFNRLNQDPTFRAAVRARWQQMYPQLQTSDRFIADQAALIQPSATLNFQKWNVSERLEDVQVIKGSWSSEVTYLRQWLTQRLTWMNSQLR